MRTIRFIILLSVSLVVFGCQKDRITTDTTEEVNPPDQIGTVDIQGTTKNIDGVLLRNTEISVYQNDKKIGTVFSDDKGFYSTRSLPLDPDLDVTLEYKKDDLSIKYRRFSIGGLEKIITNPLLGKAELQDVTKDEKALSNPSDTNFVKLYGYTLLADGTPIRGVKCSAVWEYQKYGEIGLYLKESISDFSDENGYFEMLVPKGKEIFFNTYYLRFPNSLLGQCIVEFQDIQTNPLDKWEFNKIGMLEEDYQVQLRNNINLELNILTVKGRALSCDGTPLISGVLVGSLGRVTGTEPNVIIFPDHSFVDSNYVFGPNGEFEFYLEGCKRQNVEFGISVLIRSNEYAGRIDKPNLIYPESFGNINLCIDLRDYPNEFYLTLGNDLVKNFLNGGDDPLSGIDKLYTEFYLEEIGKLGEKIIFSTESIGLGVQPLLELRMIKYRRVDINSTVVYEKTFVAKSEDVVLNITKIEDNYVYGTITGNVDTPRGNQTLDITFKIYNK